MTQFSIIIGDRGFLRQGVGIAGVDGGQGDGGWGHRVFVRTPRAAGCDAWKTTSLRGWPYTEDDFVAARTADRYAIAAQRSMRFCCPRLASWATKPHAYNTSRQPGCARPQEVFTATAKSQHSHPATRRFSGMTGCPRDKGRVGTGEHLLHGLRGAAKLAPSINTGFSPGSEPCRVVICCVVIPLSLRRLLLLRGGVCGVGWCRWRWSWGC